MTRPAGFVVGTVVPPRVAYLLEQFSDIGRMRTRARSEDEELYTTLNALRWSALQWAESVNGSQPRKSTKVRLNWYTPEQVANQTGLTSHAIRLAIREGRLPAEKTDGRWRITPADYRNFMTAHSR